MGSHVFQTAQLLLGHLCASARNCVVQYGATCSRRNENFSHFLSFFVLSAITPPSTFQISLQTWFTNSLAWEMTSVASNWAQLTGSSELHMEMC